MRVALETPDSKEGTSKKSRCLKGEEVKMLKADNGATMETDLEETPAGWVARYLINRKT